MHLSYHQDDLNTWLPVVEFSYNTSDQIPTKKSPVSTVYGEDPYFYSVEITKETPTVILTSKIQSVEQYFNRELKVELRSFKRYADKSRESPPVLNTSIEVWISSKSIKLTRAPRNPQRIAGSLSNIQGSKYSFLLLQASTSMKVYSPRFPYSSLGTSKDIRNPPYA
ncbi:hypothetical protein O181_043998 [Austropuccinia psidii MF-1]|uniref:Uncharacterized protein n=1 Tax=Austropuccinia psidii MF-1 TaxID=1389203 RepID=A0A9Q3DP87_9BASI|nr:hypothetical protein [Austropuccinia psidii MF-1]